MWAADQCLEAGITRQALVPPARVVAEVRDSARIGGQIHLQLIQRLWGALTWADMGRLASQTAVESLPEESTANFGNGVSKPQQTPASNPTNPSQSEHHLVVSTARCWQISGLGHPPSQEGPVYPGAAALLRAPRLDAAG